MQSSQTMESKQLAIIVAFYLSKFDKAALRNLGFKTDSEAFQSIGDILNVKKNYVKFRRDEFDPIHPWRKGWLRTMDRRIVNAIEALQDLSEEALGEIVLNILNDQSFRTSDDVKELTNIIAGDNRKMTDYVLRGPTGKNAEEYFISCFKRGELPFHGMLVDTREYGVGYDFVVELEDSTKLYVEVKGLSPEFGGILFTDKEWMAAKREKSKYFLVIVSNLKDHPVISIVNNPYRLVKPKRNIVKTIQVSWAVSSKELNNLR
ncbi:MAG: DUF3883 domain-containing protein [Sphingobacteriales bacterium]|nr:MAG: DUF3883 domain-containing protein [Sphingobacteriales bacterium]